MIAISPSSLVRQATRCMGRRSAPCDPLDEITGLIDEFVGRSPSSSSNDVRSLCFSLLFSTSSPAIPEMPLDLQISRTIHRQVSSPLLKRLEKQREAIMTDVDNTIASDSLKDLTSSWGALAEKMLGGPGRAPRPSAKRLQPIIKHDNSMMLRVLSDSDLRGSRGARLMRLANRDPPRRAVRNQAMHLGLGAGWTNHPCDIQRYNARGSTMNLVYL